MTYLGRQLFHCLFAMAAGFLSLSAQGGLPDVIDGIRPSLVTVGSLERSRNPAYRPLGTGFIVGDGTMVASNAHVMPESMDAAHMETLVVAFPKGGKMEVREVETLSLDTVHDLMVLRMKGAPLPALRLGDADKVREGQEVAFSGFPIPSVLGLFSVTHRGIIASISPIGIPGARASQLESKLVRQLTSSVFNVYQVEAPAFPGHSGSPVFLPETGEVIAVLNSTFVKGRKEAALSDPSGISYAIPVRFLQDLLRGLGVR